MHKIHYVLIFIACFWILTIDGQGGHEGGGGGGGGYRGSSSGSSCRTGECRSTSYIIIRVVIVGAILISVLCSCCRKGAPSMDNLTFVRSNPPDDPEACKQHETFMLSLMNSDDRNIFRNGMWSNSYYQYGKWHGPFEFILSFDPQTMQLKGWGWDNIGKFTIMGNYSNETFRMGITKTYIKGTGDEKQNLGHDVTIQLTGNPRTGVFEGKRYVKTCRYSGEDKFELRFVRDCAYYEVV